MGNEGLSIRKIKRNKEKKFRRLIQKSTEPMILMDWKGNCLEANQPILNLFKMSKEQLLQSEITQITPEIQPHMNINSKQAISSIYTETYESQTGYYDFDFQYLDTEKKPFWVHGWSIPLKLVEKLLIQAIFVPITAPNEDLNEKIPENMSAITANLDTLTQQSDISDDSGDEISFGEMEEISKSSSTRSEKTTSNDETEKETKQIKSPFSPRGKIARKNSNSDLEKEFPIKNPSQALKGIAKFLRRRSNSNSGLDSFQKKSKKRGKSKTNESLKKETNLINVSDNPKNDDDSDLSWKEKYLEMEKKFKKLEFSYQILQKQESNRKITDQETLVMRLQNKTSENNELRTQLKEKTEKLEKIEQEYSQIKTEIDKIQNEKEDGMSILLNKLNQIRNQEKEKAIENNQLRSENADFSKLFEEQSKNFEKQQTQIQSLKESLEKIILEKNEMSSEFQGKLNSIRSQLKERISENNQLRLELNDSKSKLENSQNSPDLIHANDQIVAENKILEKQKDELNEKIGNLESQNKKLEQELEENTSLAHQHGMLLNQYKDISNENHVLKIELEEIRKLIVGIHSQTSSYLRYDSSEYDFSDDSESEQSSDYDEIKKRFSQSNISNLTHKSNPQSPKRLTKNFSSDNYIFPNKFLTGRRSNSETELSKYPIQFKKEIKDIEKIEELLQIPLAVDYFKEFLSQQLNSENLAFYLEVQDFKKITTIKELGERAVPIFEKFIKPESLFEINIDSKSRDDITQMITNSQYSHTMFDEAKDIVIKHMTFNSFEPFKNTELYTTLIKKLNSDTQLEYDKIKIGTLIWKKQNLELLNSGLRFQGIPRDPIKIAEELLNALIYMLNAHYSINSEQINCDSLSHTISYRRFIVSTYELQQIDLETLDKEDLFIFFLNIYNTLFIHSLISKGEPSDKNSKRKFFTENKYIISNHEFSLLDIQNGILLQNSNTKNKNTSEKYFKPNDPREKFISNIKDNRVIFSLLKLHEINPPLRIFFKENYSEELNNCTKYFLLKNVQIDDKQKKVRKNFHKQNKTKQNKTKLNQIKIKNKNQIKSN
ncbi:electron carrier/ protein disulfide oxidoreductase [Anaeramoeba ignava]|uniref:Electron carrier/ protein disulfide oxidoreductase n=1 Tax=Anaeramoeba ignava TaxID=1746090 RepID=A0A9Q0LX52_ANAIG|nr:electron carrier/ protein disulfide oxidoreductase [Anaeramoeba ignava]